MDNGMTLADYSVLEKVGNRYRGVSTTGLTLGAVALGVGVIGIWGVNAASKARSRAAEQLASANQLAMQQAINNGNETNRMLANLIATERSSREAWQGRNMPTMAQYVDVQTNPNLSAQLMDYIRNEANATATATANNSGINSAVATDSALRVQLYGGSQPCNCPGSCGGY